jgi:hypothetical protein
MRLPEDFSRVYKDYPQEHFFEASKNVKKPYFIPKTEADRDRMKGTLFD